MSLASTSSMPVTIFLSYAREDKRLLKKLLSQLSALQRVQAVQYWYNDYATPGEPYQREVDTHLQSAHIILLLLSANFMYSNQCRHEMELALERKEHAGARVIPVLLKPVSGWEETLLGELTPLPANRRAVSQWIDPELACCEIADALSSVIAAIRASVRQHRHPSRLIEQPPSLLTQPRTGTVKKLYTQLIAADTNAIALTGIVGAGLSTLANLLYHYAEEQRSAGNGPFAAQPLKVRIDRTTSLVELLETVIDATGENLPDDSARPAQDSVALLVRTLQNLEYPRLLILDQFELLLEQRQDEAIQTLLHLFNTSPCRSRVLLISHLKLSDAEQEHYLHEFHSDGLETEEGVELLRSGNVDVPTADLQAIVEHLGGHATALSLLVPLLRAQKQLPRLKESTLQTPLENSVRSLEELYTQQLDDLQRALLCAFAIYREPVSLDAALAILDRSVAPANAVSALNKLQALYLLRANTHGYQLPTLIANYAYSRAVEALQDRETTLQSAHEKAAAYYQQQLSTSSRQLPEMATLIHNGVEACWHLCQAQQWESAYALLVQEDIFTYLLRWGRSIVLLELCQHLLSAWHAQPQQEAYLLKEAGKAYDRLGRKREAQQHFEQALPLFQQVHDRQNEASTLTHLGEACNALAQKEQALTCYQQALNICNETEAVDEHVKAVLLNDLGKLSYERSENVQALDYYEQALLLHDDTSEEATTLNNLAALYEDMGKAVEAKRAYQKAHRLFREIGDRRGEGSVLHNLGRYLSKQGRIEEALEYYKSAWRIFCEIGDRLSESVTLRNLCQLYLVQERYRAALACIFLAKKILREMQSPQEDDVQGTIALLSYQFGRELFAEMWEHFEKNDTVVVESILSDAENS